MSDLNRQKRTASHDEPSVAVDDRAKRVRTRAPADYEAISTPRPRLQYEDYSVGWICALPLEMAAAEAMLDEFHETLPGKHGDSNAYTLGSIASHNIAMACLPKGGMGNNNSATAATHMLRTFPSIVTKRLMVGIGGGAPDSMDIRLGDVIVGDQVVQHDFGKATPADFQHTAVPTKAPPAMLTAVSKLHALHARSHSRIPRIINDVLLRYPNMSNFQRPQTPDLLFEYSYKHDSALSTCQACDTARLVQRDDRPSLEPVVHYGKIASGNSVMRDGALRNHLGQKLQAICFEMEAAGLGESFPCLVIRGVCDYADSHKNKDWQRYAAIVAAAHAKELLLDMPNMPAGSSSGPSALPNASLDHDKDLRERREQLMGSLKFLEIESRHESIKEAHRATCKWFINSTYYRDWLDPEKLSHHLGFLWISGKPASGKSTIMKYTQAFTAKQLASTAMQSASSSKQWASNSDTAVISFFFNARGVALEQCTEGMYRSLLYQALTSFHDLKQVLDQFGQEGQYEELSMSWTLDMLRRLFQQMVVGLGKRRLICFIDALDECDDDQIQEMVDFFEELGELASQKHTRFLVCFSSRHYPHIELQRGGIRVTLEDELGHLQDVNQYISSKLQAGKSKIANQLRDIIIQKAAGVFLWVILVVEILNKELQHGRITSAKRLLNNLPPKLSDLFKDTLRRENSNLDDLLLCIQWVLYARRPLTCPELYFALHAGLTEDAMFPYEWDAEVDTMELMHRFVLSASKGLVEVTGYLGNVQFIHESVRDFLLKDNGIHELWPEHSAKFETFSHDCLWKCCLTYTRLSSASAWHFHGIVEQNPPFSFIMSDEAVEVGVALSAKYPFLQYATQNLLYHANARDPTAAAGSIYAGLDFVGWICLQNLFQPFAVLRVDALKPWVFEERRKHRIEGEPRPSTKQLAFEEECEPSPSTRSST